MAAVHENIAPLTPEEHQIAEQYKIDPNRRYRFLEGSELIRSRRVTLFTWALNHKCVDRLPGKASGIWGRDLIVYLLQRRWREQHGRSRLPPLPARYKTDVQKHRRDLGISHDRGCLSKAALAKQARAESQFAAPGTVRRVTSAEARVSFQSGIIPQKWYTRWELWRRFAIDDATVEGWLRSRAVRRRSATNHRDILGIDLIRLRIRLHLKRTDPRAIQREQERARRRTNREQERWERKQLPPLTTPERRIARKAEIRPTTFYGIDTAAEWLGIPQGALYRWAAQLDLIRRYPRASFIRGRAAIFYAYTRQWRAEAAERRKTGEKVSRFPPTPEPYQTRAYRFWLDGITFRENLEKAKLARRAEAEALKRRQEERDQQWEKEESWRAQSRIAPDVVDQLKDLSTIAEVCVILNRPRKTFERWIAWKWVKTFKVGRSVFFERIEVERIIATAGHPWFTLDAAERGALPPLSKPEQSIARKLSIRPDYKYSLSEAAHFARVAPALMEKWLVATRCYPNRCKDGIWGAHIIKIIAEKWASGQSFAVARA